MIKQIKDYFEDSYYDGYDIFLLFFGIFLFILDIILGDYKEALFWFLILFLEIKLAEKNGKIKTLEEELGVIEND